MVGRSLPGSPDESRRETLAAVLGSMADSLSTLGSRNLARDKAVKLRSVQPTRGRLVAVIIHATVTVAMISVRRVVSNPIGRASTEAVKRTIPARLIYVTPRDCVSNTDSADGAFQQQHP